MSLLLECLKGKTLIKIDGLEDGSEKVTFHTSEGVTYLMQHYQECCEDVYLESVVGDVSDLIGMPILSASEESNHEYEGEDFESRTWTFYKLATLKGRVTLRWLGESNGYYGERVDFILKI